MANGIKEGENWSQFYAIVSRLFDDHALLEPNDIGLGNRSVSRLDNSHYLMDIMVDMTAERVCEFLFDFCAQSSLDTEM